MRRKARILFSTVLISLLLLLVAGVWSNCLVTYHTQDAIPTLHLRGMGKIGDHPTAYYILSNPTDHRIVRRVICEMEWPHGPIAVTVEVPPRSDKTFKVIMIEERLEHCWLR